MYPDHEYDNRYENIENERKNYEQRLFKKLSKIEGIDYKKLFVHAMGALYELEKRASRSAEKYSYTKQYSRKFRTVKPSDDEQMAYWRVSGAIKDELDSLKSEY